MDELKCVDCGILPPETESAYTLIGGKAGWRLTRHRTAEGLVVADWRCPNCWAKYKKDSTPQGQQAPAPSSRNAPGSNAGPRRR
jgi:hypothetical protein